MDRLERDLREELARQVAVVPAPPRLADVALRRGRRARRRRTALVTAAGVGVLLLGLSLTSLVAPLSDRRADVAAAPLDGPPRVPLYLGQTAELLDWPDGTQRTRSLGDSVVPVAQVPGGLLVVIGGTQPALGLLGPDDVAPRVVVAELAVDGVAVADDGRRAAIVTTSGYSRQLQEVELPSGRVLRSVNLVPPVFGTDELVVPAAFSGRAILVNIGEGESQRTRLWEGNDDGVIGNVDEVLATVGGADADFSDDRDALGGRVAFSVRDDRCRTEVHQLRNGDGNPWRLCQETFAGFSPDGRAVLATDATGRALVVRDADDGDLDRTFEVPNGVRAQGWESSSTLLYTTTDGPRTVIVRCSIRTGACTQAAALPGSSQTPQPVRTTL